MVEQRRTTGAPHEQPGRRIVNPPKPQGKPRVGARQPAQTGALEPPDVCRIVEPRCECAKPSVLRRLEQVRPCLGGERGDAQLAHAVSSAGGRYVSASARCSGNTRSDPPSAAMLAAARATRAR